MRKIVSWICAAALSAGVGVLCQQPETSGPTIKTETRLVLVDAVVTDKKGAYVRDLTSKDFRVWEDNQEQEIKSFSFEADPASSNKAQRRYLVMFFDNSTMDFAQQAQARQAAGRFVDANAGPNRMMAVVEYAGGMRITQNFTDDGVRLKQVVSGVKLAPQLGNDSGGGAALNRAAAAYGTRDVVLAMKSLVKNLTNVPGRKSLVLLTGGFRLTQENMSELTELVDACNKANVAVYPIDVSGLVTPVAVRVNPPDAARQSSYLPSMAFGFQKPGSGGAGGGAGNSGGGGTGGTTGGSRTGGGTTGGAGSGGVSPGRGTGSGTGSGSGSGSGRGGTVGGGTIGGGPINPQNGRNPMTMPRTIMPHFPESATDRQQPLFMLASGTGGFVIVNTNDLLGGLEKIGREQNEHYLIGYTPEESKDGSCHALKVKVAKGGMTVRARTGYCNVKAADMLAGNPVEKDLEKLVLGSAAGNVRASMQAPYFYTAANSVRVTVAMEIPSEALEFKKQKGGRYHSDLNLLGIVYRTDGGVAARFSDTLKFDFDNKKAMEAWLETPMLHYEKDLEAAPGKYTMKVVVGASAGSFGRLELPVNIDAYDGKAIGLSGLALSSQFHKVTNGDVGLDTALTEDRTPLMVGGMQITPSGRNRFRKTEAVAVYAEIYDSALAAVEPVKDFAAGFQMRILDRKTGEVKQDTGMVRAAEQFALGNPVIPLGLKVQVDKLQPGLYNLELSAADTLGGKVTRLTGFEVE